MAKALTQEQVESWVKGYIKAWQTGDPKDIKAIFSEDAESYEWPYETSWVGRDSIIKGWNDRKEWQEGGWTFDDWSILMINGDTAAVKGTGVYKKLGRFANLWTVTLNKDSKCTMFRMWNNEI